MNIIDRVEKRTHVPSDRLVINPSLPTDCKIELTSKCNFNCSFCAVGQNKRVQGEMDNKTLKVILDACKYLDFKEVGLFLLGESLLRDDLAYWIHYAKNIEIPYVYLTSNGYLCSPNKFDELKKAGLDSLKISLNAGSPAEFKNVTGIDGYEKVMDNIRYAYANKGDMNFCVSCVYDLDHEDDMRKLEDEMFFIGCDFYFLPKYNQAGNVKAPICGNIGTMKNPVKNVPCWELFNTMRFTWDGYMAYCSFPHTEEFKIGHIGGLTIENMWNSEKFIKLRQAHLNNKLKGTICEKCING
jgi:radical SAM protein with 4Fe4S-binding SPASM domain